MNLKEKIQEGEKLLEEYQIILNDINLVQEKFELEKAFGVLMRIDKIKIAERIDIIKTRLDEKKKEYTEQFEKLSREVNLQMNNVIASAKTYFGKEPAGITAQMEDLVKQYEENKSNIEQEEKNSVYEELKSHLRFMKKNKK